MLYGQSWGGILAIEYALAYPEQLKGVVISKMMSDVPAYNAYAQDVLKPAMNQDALREIESLEAAGDIENPAERPPDYSVSGQFAVARTPSPSSGLGPPIAMTSSPSSPASKARTTSGATRMTSQTWSS